MSSKNKPRGWVVPAFCAAVLAGLFWRSFLPGYVHFNNDGPLGALSTAWMQFPGCMTGQWDDINLIGANVGTATPDIISLIRWAFGPVGCAKFVAFIALWILGTAAWVFFRQLKLSALASTLGALAAMLNSTFFSTACWGVASQEIAAGMDFFALALVVGSTPEMPALVRSARLALAGLCVGMNVMEAADIGALYSLLIAMFVFFHALATSEGAILKKAIRGVGRVVVVAAFAGFIAVQIVVALVGTSVQGVAGTAQDEGTKAAQWDWATQWSLPKAETFGLFIPGLFGYKLNTPADMMPELQDAYRNGAYWGGMGRDPAIDRYFDAGSPGQQPSGFMRFTGGGNYCGILVLLIAGWAIAQSFRRQNSLFPAAQKRMIWFWTAVIFLCLLFAWGRFAPFYALLYQLPYFSTIRNPAKFLNFFSFALVIVFAYGVHALNRRYLDAAAKQAAGLSGQIKAWWAKATGFDRKWTFASLGLLVAGVLGWLIYSAQKPALIAYLQKVGFGDPDPTHENSAPVIAAFSLGQAGWFLALFAIALGLLLLVISGYFNGPRAKIGAVLLGGFLIFDMGRANLPWVVHWDYKQKYEVGSLNPIVEFLRDKPYEHRVAYGVPWPLSTPPQFELFDQLYKIEWMQHHFPYYNIQSLDIVQMPRTAEDIKAFQQMFRVRLRPASAGGYEIVPESFPLAAREWQLTNTRYLLGPAGFVDVLNQQLDPVQHRFRIVQRFTVALKPGVEQFHQRLEELSAFPNENGDYALIEFTGALPRAKLYSHWQANPPAAVSGFTTNGLSDTELSVLASAGTNDFLTLKTLASPAFDPQQTVLLAKPLPNSAASTNDNPGTVEYKSYSPKQIVLAANVAVPSVLLLNDKFDPQWRVTVDGQPAELLRCNFLMRGVYLPTAGQHTVEFQFSLPHRPLYITLAGLGVAVLLCAFLALNARKRQAVAS